MTSGPDEEGTNGSDGTEADDGDGSAGETDADGVTTGTGPTGLPLALAVLVLAGLLGPLRR